MRLPGALLLAFVLSVPPVGSPQVPSSETAEEPNEAETAGRSGLVGSWAGGARLSNDWPGHPCRYMSAADDQAVRLEISAAEVGLGGSVAIDVAAEEGSGCPPLRKRFLITEVITAQGVVSLTDSGGHQWDLSLVQGGHGLRGMMTWQQGATDEPLAEDFKFADDIRPRSRLSGEVQLRRLSEDTGAEEVGDRTTSASDHVMNVGAVLGATAVGLAGLYGVNKLGQGSSEEGTVTCSPRRCVVGAPGEPCFCEGNVVSGADCGQTETGVPIEGLCMWPSMPCEATLSCNSGLCEDQFGRCPF